MGCSGGVLLFGAVLVVIGLLYILRYLGLIGSIKVTVGKPVLGRCLIAYKRHTGPYEKCGPHFEEVLSVFPGDPPCIGVYFDDPAVVPKNDLRYAVGAVLPVNPYISSNEASPSVVEHMKKHNFLIAELPEVQLAVNAQFPFHFNLSGMLGAMRVYPAMEKYVKKKQLSPAPFVEVYLGKIIHYMGMLSHQKEYMDLA